MLAAKAAERRSVPDAAGKNCLVYLHRDRLWLHA